MIPVGAASGHLVVGVLWLLGVTVAVLEQRVPRARRAAFAMALGAVSTAALLAVALWPGDATIPLAGGALRLDGFALFVQAFALAGAVGCLLLGRNRPAGWPPGANGLLLMSAAGVALVAMAVDLIAVMVGFAVAFIPLLGLAALRDDDDGREAAIKGAVLVLLALALLGMGTALLACRSGATGLDAIRAFFIQSAWIGDDPLQVAAMALVLAGLGLFLAVVPLHMLFTDLAEGLPAPASLLLTGSLMAAGLAAAGRVLLVGFGPEAVSGPGYLSWPDVIHAAGLLALLVGNAMALVQRRLKRLLACLAFGQAGLGLLAVAAIGSLGGGPGSGSVQAVAGLLAFLAVHAVNWLGLFIAVGSVEMPGERVGLGRLEGLAREHPWLAAAVGLALLCMAGMPLTAGFFVRLYLLDTMVAAGWLGTAVVVALSLGLVLVMSLGLVTAMFMRPRPADLQLQRTIWLDLAAWLASLTILVLGVLPGGVFELAQRSAVALLGG